jgi:glycosyltransferase involved in cell wall biosynthesis
MFDSPAPRTIVFWTPDPDAPSFRHRLQPTVPILEDAGTACTVDRIPSGRYFSRVIERRQQLATCDLLVLAKLKLAVGEDRLVRKWARRVIFDFDDAIYLRRPRSPGQDPDTSALRWNKFARVCRLSDLVIACNSTLADQSRTWARRIEVVPTPVECSAYDPAGRGRRTGRVLVWVGMPENVAYLEMIRPVIARLRAEHPDLSLRVISSHFPDWDDIPIERIEWSEETETRHIDTADIGLMPLTEDAWASGKCAFKLLQYKAAGLPSVATDVGTNREVVQHGEDGFLATSPEQWYEHLRRLVIDADLRRVMGMSARRHALDAYDRSVVVPRTVSLIRSTMTDSAP